MIGAHSDHFLDTPKSCPFCETPIERFSNSRANCFAVGRKPSSRFPCRRGPCAAARSAAELLGSWQALESLFSSGGKISACCGPSERNIPAGDPRQTFRTVRNGRQDGASQSPAPECWSRASSPHAPFRPLSRTFYLPRSVTCYWTQVMLFNDTSAPGPADHRRHLGRASGRPETPSRRVCPLEMAARVQDRLPV